MRGVSAVTDFYVLVSGSSAPHLKALYEGLLFTLKQEGARTYRKAGNPDGGWLIADYIDVVIHILSREAREHYALEELWENAPRVS